MILGRALALGLAGAVSFAAVAKEAIWTGSTRKDGAAWNLGSANWRVEGSGGAATFASGDRALFLDGAVSRTVTNALETFDVSGIVFSNATDALVWNPSSWNQNKTKLGGAFDKFGAGTLTVNGRFDALMKDFTVHAGRFVAAAGSAYSGEYYSPVGSLHDKRNVSFLTNATLEVTANAIFGGLGSAGTVHFLFDRATIEFNRNDLIHHFGATTFRDASFTYSQRVKQMLFSYDQSFSGTRPYVIGSTGTDAAGYGTVFNSKEIPEAAQSEVFVDDITGDDGDDVTVASPLIDVSTGRESAGYYGVTAFRKTGPGTMCLASGYGSTTGIVQVAEGTLRVAAGTDYADGRTALGRIDPALKRTVSAFGGTAILRLDSPLGPRHHVRNWELSVADGARVVLGDDLPYLQLGELAISAGHVDYSRLGGFGVTRRLSFGGNEPTVLPVFDGPEGGKLTIGLSGQDTAAGNVWTSPLEIAVTDITGDGAADATIGLALADLPSAPSGSPFAGKTFRGRVRKTGAGTLRSTAANLHSGGTDVEEGAFEADGSVPGAVTVASGAFLGGVGTVESAALEADGGLCVRADGDTAEALTVGTFAAAGRVRVRLTGGRGRSFTYANRPVLRIAAKPQALDLSGWTCETEDGAVELALAYDAARGEVSVSGSVTIAAAVQGPALGFVDGYDIDWLRDTLEATRDGVWSVPRTAAATVEDGALHVVTDAAGTPVVFTPTTACRPCPRAVFDMTLGLYPFKPSAAIDIKDSAVTVVVREKSDGRAVYAAGTGEGVVELCGAVPTKGADGLYTAHLRIEVDEGSAPARISFVIDGTRMTDTSGRTWLPRAGTGSVSGEISVEGEGLLGNVVARKSDTVNRFAEPDGAGGWRHFGVDGIAAVAAAGRRFYVALPEDLPPGVRYDTGLVAADVTASGLSVFPGRGMACALSVVDGRWVIDPTTLPTGGYDFTVPPDTKTFVGALPDDVVSQTLSVTGGDSRYGGCGGELVILEGSRKTPRAVTVGRNVKLTTLKALGPDPIALAVAADGVFDAAEVAGGQSVGALDVDCTSGFGSMRGTRLVDAGDLRMTHAVTVRSLGWIPCDLTATENAAALIGWTFLADGEEVRDKPFYAYDADDRIVTWRNHHYPKDEDAGWRNLPMWGGGYMMNVVFTSDPKILYAHADVAGPFRSDDGGLSWRQLGRNLTPGEMNDGLYQLRSLTVDPRDPDSLVGIAGTETASAVGGFMVSRNGGRSWRKTGWTKAYGNGKRRMLGQVLARDPNDPDTLIGGEDWYGIFLSRDNGESWTRTGPTNLWCSCIHWDLNVPHRVYACAPGGMPIEGYMPSYQDGRDTGLFVSDDGGANWRRISTDAPRELVQAAGDGRLVGIFGYRQLKSSVDGGATWSAFEEGIAGPSGGKEPTSYGATDTFCAVGHGKGFWLLGTELGVLYKRGVGDARWTQIAIAGYATTDSAGEVYEAQRIAKGNARMDALCSIIVDPLNDDHWFTTDWYTIWETTDAGAHFTSRNIGISQLCSSCFEADPLDANHLAYGVHDMTLFGSSDGGRTFGRVSGLKTQKYGDDAHVVVMSYAYSPDVQGLVYAAAYDVYGGVGVARSDDHGVNWTYPSCAGMPRRTPGVYGVNKVAFRPGRPTEIWACVGGEVGEGKGGPYVSTDDGANWTWKGQGMDKGSKYYSADLVWAFHNRNLVFSSDGSGVTICSGSSAVYRWDDAAATWRKCTFPSGFTPSHTEVEADPHTPGRFLLAGTYVVESLDGGASWHAFTGCDVNAGVFAFDPNTPGLLVFSCTDSTIRVSWDSGKTFSVLEGGVNFGKGRNVYQATVDRKRLFASTSGYGVYRRDLKPPRGLMAILK